MFLTSLTVLKTSQKMITQKSNKKYRKVVGIRKWSTTHKERIYNKFFFNVVIGDGSYRILHVTPCVWTAGLFDSSCTCVQSRVLLYKDIGTVFQELKGSTQYPHKEIYRSNYYFILLPSSSSYFLVVRPSAVRPLVSISLPPFPPSLLVAHFLFSPYVVTSTPALTCTKHMHEPNAKGNFRVSRTDRRLFLFFPYREIDDDVEAKKKKKERKKERTYGFLGLQCALKTSSPVT